MAFAPIVQFFIPAMWSHGLFFCSMLGGEWMKGTGQDSQPSEAAPVIIQASWEPFIGLDGEIWGRWGLGVDIQ